MFAEIRGFTELVAQQQQLGLMDDVCCARGRPGYCRCRCCCVGDCPRKQHCLHCLRVYWLAARLGRCRQQSGTAWTEADARVGVAGQEGSLRSGLHGLHALQVPARRLGALLSCAHPARPRATAASLPAIFPPCREARNAVPARKRPAPCTVQQPLSCALASTAARPLTLVIGASRASSTWAAMKS